jgi:hypothetical protein
MQHVRLSRCGSIAGCMALLLAALSVASAEMGVVTSFPLPRVRMRSGLTVEVDTRGVAANGYRRVRVKVMNTPLANKPPVPVTADRRVRVVLSPSGVGHVSRVRTSKVIEIPEKQSSAEVTIPVPTAGDWYEMDVRVYEGGELLEDASGPMTRAFFAMGGVSESLPTLLFVDYDVPDRATRDNQLSLMAGVRPPATVDTFDLPDYSLLVSNIPYSNVGIGMGTAMPPAGATSTRLTDAQILALTSQQGKVQLLPPAELPAQWVELSCYDIAFVSIDDLERMARQNSRQRRALVDWLHSGPALVVYGVGDELARLKDVERLLELPPLPQTGTSGKMLRGWKPAAASDSGPTNYQNPQRNVYGPAAMGGVTATMTAASGTPANQGLFSPTGLPFAGRPAGLGWVVAVAHPDPFPASSADWQWLLNSIPPRHQIWSTRHGMSYTSYNPGLWNWYIPGVGAAPVFSFLLLATLFAVVIGPVNYLLLGKIHRLYLLLVTVPAGAAVVTLCLFAYAVLSDGLGVKARIRSYSLLDQKTGRTVSWSRQSYYASLVPSQGLIYPNDAVIWPLDEKPNTSRQGPLRQLAWGADGQRLSSGYLSSRRLTQLMVTRSARTKSRLTVVQKAGSPPRVANELGSTIEQLVLCDRQGNYFWANEPLAAGQGQNLLPYDLANAQKLLGQIVDDHRPRFPEGYDAVAEERRTDSPWNRMYWSSSSRVVQEMGILETNLASLKRTTEPLLEPGMYVAVMQKNPDVPLGISEATEAESFHVIVGRW